MNIGKGCYKFEVVPPSQQHYPPLFPSSALSATYIIHLEGNGRIDGVYEQLRKFRPTFDVYVVHNRGFKICRKAKHVRSTLTDIIDANLRIFEHADSVGYDEILVLEDDFFFDRRIRSEPVHVARVSEFLIERRDTPFTYLLGTLPLWGVPILGSHPHTYRTLFTMGMHACIYNKYTRRLVSNGYDPATIDDWDIFTNCLPFPRYMYSQPLCLQLFRHTDNRRNWRLAWKHMDFVSDTGSWLMDQLDLQNTHSKGYAFFYCSSRATLPLLIVALCVCIILCIRSPPKSVGSKIKMVMGVVFFVVIATIIVGISAVLKEGWTEQNKYIKNKSLRSRD